MTTQEQTSAIYQVAGMIAKFQIAVSVFWYVFLGHSMSNGLTIFAQLVGVAVVMSAAMLMALVCMRAYAFHHTTKAHTDTT